MKAAQYIFLNKGLGMSTGKATAQGGHAAVEGLLISHPTLDSKADCDVWRAWREGLHYAKYVMECRDTEHLLTSERYLNERGFRTVLIIDEGHTEVPALTPTALAVELVDKDDPHTKATFSSFKLYKDERPQEPEPTPEEVHAVAHGESTSPATRGSLAAFSASETFPPACTLWGYPVKLSLEYDTADLDITSALKPDPKTGEIVVSADVALERVHNHQIATGR